jgi:cation diffusion facilitator CzcD-associated flavoprotein CzcO
MRTTCMFTTRVHMVCIAVANHCAHLFACWAGLRVEMVGGVAVTVDGVVVDPAQCYFYKGCMLSGVPNSFIGMGCVQSGLWPPVQAV